MQWHSAKFKKLASLVFLSSACFAEEGLQPQVDPTKLWLPSSHAKLYFDLERAAAAALAVEPCFTLLEATIDLEQSTDGHPIFRVLCRKQGGRSYNEMVDGLSFETLTTVVPEAVEPTEEELEALRLAEEKRKQEELEARLKQLADNCVMAIREKVALMEGLEWLTPLPPEPQSYDESTAIYQIDFNGKDIQGRPLQYRAKCRYRSDDELVVSIKSRS